jgi:hypothetical protein
MNKKFLYFALIMITFLSIGSCKTASSVAPTVLSAVLTVNGQEVTNGSISSLNQGDLISIKAQFSDPQGNHTIKKAIASFSHGTGMMDHMGEIHLWDDGTHGDENHGDGWFTMMDEMSEMMSMMGIGWAQRMGTHQLEFYCVDEDGNESNHISVHLNIN